MADDPNKKRNDGWFVSSQPHEYQYFFDSIKKACSKSSDTEIAESNPFLSGGHPAFGGTDEAN